MSCRCWGVNRIVFIPPPRHPHVSTPRSVPPLSTSPIVGSSGTARLYDLLGGIHLLEIARAYLVLVPGLTHQISRGFEPVLSRDSRSSNPQASGGWRYS